MEEKKMDYQLQISMMPLARTAMSEKGGRSQADLQKRLFKMLDGLTPWKVSAVRGRYSGKVKPGTIAVILDGKDKDNPLFKDAEIVKR